MLYSSVFPHTAIVILTAMSYSTSTRWNVSITGIPPEKFNIFSVMPSSACLALAYCQRVCPKGALESTKLKVPRGHFNYLSIHLISVVVVA